MPESHTIETRRVGEYGHFVAPLSQLAADVEDFVGASLEPYRAETEAIRRDEQGVHPEEAAILYMLVRALRPSLMLETGTFKGYSTAEIARAMERNSAGHLVTVDLATETGGVVPPELLHRVTFHRGRPSAAFARELPHAPRLDLFFHDSLHTFMNTLGELIWFADHYSEKAVVVCHDAKMDYLDEFGVGKAVRMFARELGLEYRILDTTCGLAIIKWSAQLPEGALAGLRTKYSTMQARANEGLLRRALRRIAGI
jgi:hypothetical protein